MKKIVDTVIKLLLKEEKNPSKLPWSNPLSFKNTFFYVRKSTGTQSEMELIKNFVSAINPLFAGKPTFDNIMINVLISGIEQRHQSSREVERYWTK